MRKSNTAPPYARALSTEVSMRPVVECGFCMTETTSSTGPIGEPQTVEGFCQELFDEGWRYLDTGAGGDEGWACGECVRITCEEHRRVTVHPVALVEGQPFEGEL